MKRSRGMRRVIALVGFGLLTMLIPAPAADAYFCRPYARSGPGGIHVGTCRDIVVVPVAPY